MSWKGVITDTGRTLLAEWMNGNAKLIIEKATVGSGIREEANMRAATGLVSEEDTADIVRSIPTTTGVKFKIQVNPSEGDQYTAHEVGLWAYLDSWTIADPVLLALHQDSDGGVVVPKKTVSPDFVFSIFAEHAISNTESLTVNINPNAYVSNSSFIEVTSEVNAMSDKIDAAAMRPNLIPDPEMGATNWTFSKAYNSQQDWAEYTRVSTTDPTGGDDAEEFSVWRTNDGEYAYGTTLSLTCRTNDAIIKMGEAYEFSVWLKGKGQPLCSASIYGNGFHFWLTEDGTANSTITNEWKKYKAVIPDNIVTANDTINLSFQKRFFDESTRHEYTVCIYNPCLYNKVLADVAFSGDYDDLKNKPDYDGLKQNVKKLQYETGELVRISTTKPNHIKDPASNRSLWTYTTTPVYDVEDPEGGYNAVKLPFNGSGELAATSLYPYHELDTSDVVRESVWMKADSTISVGVGKSSGAIFSVGTEWSLYSLEEQLGSTGNPPFRIMIASGLAGNLYIYKPQVTDIIDYESLADAILNKLTSKTFVNVNRGTKTLIDAINGIIESGSINDPSLTWPLADSAGEVGDRPYARAFKLGDASSGNQDLNLLYYPSGSTSYKTNKIFDSDGVFLPNPIFRQAHVQKVTATASGTVGADGTVSATATITTVSGASDYLLIPIACNFGYVTGVSRSGTTITVNMRNLTAAARTMAATIAVIPLRGDNNT